jgi:hypothetical protein
VMSAGALGSVMSYGRRGAVMGEERPAAATLAAGALLIAAVLVAGAGRGRLGG